MARACAIIPKVTNKDGQEVESRLFNDLLSYTGNRESAIRFYLKTKNEEFIKRVEPRLEFDEYNEPTIKSLLEKTNLKTAITEEKVLNKLNRDIGYYKGGKDVPARWAETDENYRNLMQKAIKFNQGSEFKKDFVARVIKIGDRETGKTYLGVKIDKRNKLNSIESDKETYNYNLNERLKEILTESGVSIGTLTDLEKRLGIRGVTDFSVAKDTATGLIEMIRLANGIEGEKALPEEFAHFAIEALGNSPIVNRLLNTISSNNLVSEILGEDYSTYNSLYSGDEARLAKEAAGKLLAKHMLNRESISNRTYGNILRRVIEAVKSFFRNISSSRIQKALIEANKGTSILAENILDKQALHGVDIGSISSSSLYYNTSERIERDTKILKNIIDSEKKRLDIYSKRGNKAFDKKQRLLLDSLETSLAEHSEIEGIYTYVYNALEELKKLDIRLESATNDTSNSIKDRASVLRDIRNYLYSYKSVLQSIREGLVEEERFKDNRYGERVRVVVDNATILLGDLFSKYNKSAMPTFIEFIKPFIGEGVSIPYGKYKGKTLSAEDLLKAADKDISIFDRWLDSMADSSDTLARVLDNAVKLRKESARLRTIDLMKEIQAATLALEKAGIKNTDWMYERDSKGNLTGRYISENNISKFKEEQSKFYESLKEKYGEDPIGDDYDKYRKERRNWIEENTEVVNGIRKPKNSIYRNTDFERLNSAQKEYYDTIMNIKSSLDSYLPDSYTSLLNAPKIRKDLVERVLSSESLKSGAKQVWEGIKDGFIRRSDDTELGTRATLIDFEGHEVQMLPIYYTKIGRGENMNDISTDVTSTLISYAAMAIEYDEMNKVIDVLELGRDLIREREIVQTSGNKPLVERIKHGNEINEKPLIKRGDETKVMQRINDFFTMQIYGRYMSEEGSIGNISLAKSANFLNKLSALSNLALNSLAGISNVATGTVMMRIESIAGEFFSEKDTIIADRIYATSLPSYLGEVGKRAKTNKLSLWDEKFNVMQEYDKEVRELDFDRRKWFARMFGSNALFVMNNVGEHWMQNRTSLALASTYKMKSPNGKIVNLWDAMEVVPIDPNNKSLGAKLEVKRGYTKLDGTEFTTEDIIKFSRKSAAINERMHGIYNKADKSAIQKLALGRMAVMYRKWIKPGMNRRFSSLAFNYDLDQWIEGYYRTSGRFMLQLAKDLRKLQFDIGSRWGELTNHEKANIKRALAETGHFLAVALVLGLIDWPESKRSPWLIRMAEYQARRLYTELGVLIPGKSMLTEGLRILKSPAAGINTAENLLDLTSLMNPMNYIEEVGSGRYKGESKAYKIFFESPVVPMNKTIYRGLHPEEGIPFFKQ